MNPSILLILACWFAPLSASAVIFYSTGDPEYNTTAPAGDLAESGWELEGLWGGFLGTPVAPHFFITASHISGAGVGDKLYLGSSQFTAVAFFDDPDSDLRIWQVQETFPVYVPLYTAADEVGRNVVVFGRGTQRGAEVVAGGLFGSKLKGWQAGQPDGRKRWGENQVAEIFDGDQFQVSGSQSVRIGDLLRMPFDSNGGINESALSAGDSGGGLFIKDGNIWKLAGIHFAVDGPYNTTDSGPGFNAAIFDDGGLYKGGEGSWVRQPEFLGKPGAFYSTRISSHIAWINSIISAPSSGPAILLSASTATGPFQPESSAMVDPNSKTFEIAPPTGGRFFVVSASTAVRITQISLRQGRLIIQYQ